MAASKKPSSNPSPLGGLLDLLVDLQVLDASKKPSQAFLTSQSDAVRQDETSQAASVESDGGTPLPEPESDIHQAQQPEGTLHSPEPTAEVASTESLTALENLSNLLTQALPEPPSATDLPEPNSVPPEPLDERHEELTLPRSPDSSSELTAPIERSPLLPESAPQPPAPASEDEGHAAPFVNPSHLTNTPEEDDPVEQFERLQRLLLTPEVLDSRELFVELEQKVKSLEHQIYEPEELIHLLLPLITKLLGLKVNEAKAEVAQAIAPLIEEMIEQRSQQNKAAICAALAPVLPEAVAQRVLNSPGEYAKALGPEMGTAIKEQITVEREAMVDALYPVIGSTISKYMAEVVQSINQKVENTLSLEGISRKIRAKLQGVSEAELIFKESMPFAVQAIFLIHKDSGLIISEVQPPETQRLESEMVAGMLTAIRSFVNDCIAQSGDISEIDQIEYGSSQINIEGAGYGYLALVTKGEPPYSFIEKTRRSLGIIVQQYGEAIQHYDGDPSNVPEPVHAILADLAQQGQPSIEPQKRKPPVALLAIATVLLSAVFIPWGIHQYRSGAHRRLEEQAQSALASDPELAVYRLDVEADRNSLTLSGMVPNDYLRQKAARLVSSEVDRKPVENEIIAVNVPADPVLAAAEVDRVQAVLNQREGVEIAAKYEEGTVTVTGVVLEAAEAQEITQAFAQIPGVEAVTNTVQPQAQAIAARIYFGLNSSTLNSSELPKIERIGVFLQEYPNQHLRLLGHSDRRGDSERNRQLAMARAEAVKAALVRQGIAPERLQLDGTTEPPRGIDAEQPLWLSRCVEFEAIEAP
jgi:outer membrane protein OmpA-like peptidoglycan-associated protein